MKRWKILLADDHDIVLTGLRLVLDQPDFEIVGAVQNGRALVDAARELLPDVIVTDVAMPVLSGIDAARQIRSRDHVVKIVFFTMHSEFGYAFEALSLGGCGYVLKSSVADELPLAIREVLAGRPYVAQSLADLLSNEIEVRSHLRGPGIQRLTSRQREVLALLAEGHPVKEIAFMLHVSPKTVEFHKYRIMKLLHLRTVADLARYAQRRGIVE